MHKYPRVANYRCNPECVIAKMNLINSSVPSLCSDARPWLRAQCQQTLPKTPEEDPGGTSTRNANQSASLRCICLCCLSEGGKIPKGWS